MKYLFESAVFQKIGRVADFFLVSLLWIVTSIPIITIIPATISMYYAVVKSVKYHAGTSSIRNFFHAFRVNIKQGLLLSICYVVVGVILYTFVDVAIGVGLFTIYSKVYLVLTFLYSLVVIELSLWLLPVISRFSIKLLSATKLAFHFMKRRLLQSVPYVLALLGVAILCYIVPPLILILPAGFCFSLSNLVEPLLVQYMEEHTDETMELPTWLKENE